MKRPAASLAAVAALLGAASVAQAQEGASAESARKALASQAVVDRWGVDPAQPGGFISCPYGAVDSVDGAFNQFCEWRIPADGGQRQGIVAIETGSDGQQLIRARIRSGPVVTRRMRTCSLERYGRSAKGSRLRLRSLTAQDGMPGCRGARLMAGGMSIDALGKKIAEAYAHGREYVTVFVSTEYRCKVKRGTRTRSVSCSNVLGDRWTARYAITRR